MTAIERWMRRSPVSDRDLSLFRIGYAGYVLVTIPDAVVTGLPRLAWVPPFGPFRLLDTAPPGWVVEAIAVVLAVSAGMLAVGWFTRTSSLVVGLAQLALIGIINSYGSIHHTILLVLAPLILAWSGWGHHFGVDARWGRRPENMLWPPRLLAVCIGVAFLSSAIPKIRSGWLDPTTHAVWGEFLARWHRGETDGIRPFFRTIESGVFWETLDLATVALEIGMIVACLSWRAFRVAIAIAALFHLAVLLLIGIAFYPNPVAYGAFVTWALFARASRASDPPDDRVGRARVGVAGGAGVLVIAGAALTIAAVDGRNVTLAIQDAVVVVGAAVGSAHLLAEGLSFLTWLRPRVTRPEDARRRARRSAPR